MSLYKIVPGSGKTNDTVWVSFPSTTTNVAIDPIAKTSYLVPNNYDNIAHYAGVRLRVLGSGNLDMVLRDQDQQSSVALAPLALVSTNERYPYLVTSFVTQRAQLEFSTNVIDEIFTIHLIIVFVKITAMEYPG